MCSLWDSNPHLLPSSYSTLLKLKELWWTLPGSNRWPQACKASALPSELRAHIDCYLCTDGQSLHPDSFLKSLRNLVGNKGLEPLRLAALEPKSSASTNSANSPCASYARYTRLYLRETVCLNLVVTPSPLQLSLTNGGRGGTRTHDPQINSLLR